MTSKDTIVRVKASFGVESLTSFSEVKAIVFAGSLARREFIEGWSDIDILVLAERPQNDLFFAVSDWTDEVSGLCGTKVGIEIVYLEKLTSRDSPSDLGGVMKYMKTFYRVQSKPDLIIFERNGYKLPEFDITQFKSADSNIYLRSIVSYMYKFLSTRRAWVDRKATMRKIVKNILFVLQTYTLSNSGKLIENFEELLNVNAYDTELKLTNVNKWYGKRHSWRELSDSDISLVELTEIWSDFLDMLNVAFK